MNLKSARKLILVECSIILFVFICLVPIISKPCIWFDESFTINLARRPFSELFRIASLDVHPPLYYLIVKLFITFFGDSLIVFHLPSMLSFLVLVLISVLFFNRYFTVELALIYTTVLCSVPNMLLYALQLRMYSMAMLFVTAGFYLIYMIMLQYQEGGGRKALQ